MPATTQAAPRQGRRVRLHPLTYLNDGDGVVVGRVATDDYAVLPPDGAALLQRLEVDDVETAAAWYEATYGERVDMEDFLDTLADFGLLADLGLVADQYGSGLPLPTGPPLPTGLPLPTRSPLPSRRSLREAARPLRWHRLGRLVFSPVAWVLYTAVVGAAVIACTVDARLVPHHDHVFFSRYLLVVELVVAFGQIPLIAVHEAFHVLAARRIGVKARIRLGHRLYFVVFETVMDGLVIVPRRKRYLPMLSGMLADLVLAATLTLVAAATLPPATGSTGSTGSTGATSAVPLVPGLCLALAFTTLIRFTLEFVLFLRTDVYYLIASLAGCVDLHTTSTERLRNLGLRLARRPARMVDPAGWHPNDVRAARWYTPLHVAGYALAFWLLAAVLLPISWRFLASAVAALMAGDVASPHFWDAAGLLALNLAQPLLALLMKIRDSRKASR